MKAELRADGLHIFGYVNVPGRESRPIITPRGKVIEVIEQRAFERAINRAEEIRMLLDHDRERVLASTSDGTLALREDEIGLRAEATVTDETVIAGAKQGKLKGWSFNMRHVSDSVEERAEGQLPIRHVKDFDMDEITLVMNRVPVYSATSVEVRAEGEEVAETRAESMDVAYSELEPPKPKYDNSKFAERLKRLSE